MDQPQQPRSSRLLRVGLLALTLLVGAVLLWLSRLHFAEPAPAPH